jgi:putative hemolysin
MFDYEVKIAQNKTEVEQMLRLRYEIFTQELVGIWYC